MKICYAILALIIIDNYGNLDFFRNRKNKMDTRSFERGQWVMVLLE